MAAVGAISALVVTTPASAAPAAEQAGTVTYYGLSAHNLLVFRGTSGPDFVSVTMSADRRVTLTDSLNPLTALMGCDQIAANKVSCRIYHPGLNAEFDLLGGSDTLYTSTRFTGTVHGREGDDAWKRIDTALDSHPSATAFYGGMGTDTVDYSSSFGGVKVSLDSSANDGKGLDRDDIRDDIERIHGSQYSDVVTGSPYVNRTEVLIPGDGADQVWGYGGNDTVDLRESRASVDTVNCGLGTDTVIGRHTTDILTLCE
ncbi:hypothetical protein ACTG9Q_15880 [Actinokineospora sp. 24-640]